MKTIENLIHSIRGWYYKRLGFEYDGSKRMWFKTRSKCCNETVMQYLPKPNTYRWKCNKCNKQCEPITRTFS